MGSRPPKNPTQKPAATTAGRRRAAKRASAPATGAERLRRNGIEPGNPGNSGGKKGRSGRPPKAFREFCATLAKDAAFQRSLAAAAKDRKSKHFIGAAKLVLAYGEGLPTQRLELRDLTLEDVLKDVPDEVPADGER